LIPEECLKLVQAGEGVREAVADAAVDFVWQILDEEEAALRTGKIQ
jgi:hypothetical protein